MNPAPSSSPATIWRAIAWVSGAILALAIILALGSTVRRLQQSLDVLDQPDTTAASFEAMTERSLARTKLGLLVGVLTAPVYIVSLIQHYRHRASSTRE
jgi:NADH:ubiquinone oxidoreductase subunit 6 (subunit J)